MTGQPPFEPSAWARMRLVAFDVDGTLYRQRRLRLQMARDMLMHALSRRSLEVFTVLRAFRKIRERLGDQQTPDFDRVLLAETAAATRRSPVQVQAIVSEWIERRPLRYLAGCRYPGLPELFAGLRREGKIVGILSDYPVEAKLSALGLQADHIVCASDAGVGVLKPHPRGLQVLIDAANVQPDQTVLIGDRPERDGLAARRAGAWPLIRAGKPIAGWQSFARFDDPIFSTFLRS